ncbi:DUF4148 domain-containing protein [Paraburkholderia elongata]|uniref:DUF4148 domain-containing protein n=1 Tax=Paraburkholderia elongata TaxID=2675747 RepID=A0A972NYZ9_9BURK|nr:DUF4148 domain-containing protein [Paraburkholderia elongata]NPT60140.1 DUF4148 domain-containing protein [Paraburkholderia elongata]
MKSVTRMVLIAALFAAPVVSFAQSSQSVSRAQVRAELAQLEKAGYDPHDWIHYPENIQAAEAKVAAQNATAQAPVSGYGGAVDGTSRSGAASGM